MKGRNGPYKVPKLYNARKTCGFACYAPLAGAKSIMLTGLTRPFVIRESDCNAISEAPPRAQIGRAHV